MPLTDPPNPQRSRIQFFDEKQFTYTESVVESELPLTRMPWHVEARCHVPVSQNFVKLSFKYFSM